MVSALQIRGLGLRSIGVKEEVLSNALAAGGAAAAALGLNSKVSCIGAAAAAALGDADAAAAAAMLFLSSDSGIGFRPHSDFEKSRVFWMAVWDKQVVRGAIFLEKIVI